MRFSEKRMAEIKSSGWLSNLTFRQILFISVLLLFPYNLASQNKQERQIEKKKIILKYADDVYIDKDKQTGKDLHRALGNAVFTHNEVIMSCDSAHWSRENNEVTAYSRIHIEQGDTLDLYGDYLFYDGRTEMAIVTGNVILVDKETYLYTDAIDYDVRNKIARYNDHGRIINADNTLTSIKGVYYVSDNIFNFKDSVKIVNPDYIMTADTMDYNTKTETAFFTGPTELNGDSIYLYCEKGWYDTKNDVTTIWKNAVIDNREQIIHGDSLFFDDITGYGQSWGNVTIEDTTNNLIIKGNYAWYVKQPESFMITDSAMFIQVSKGDSLFLHGDTISSKTISDTSGISYRLMKSYYGCRIFSDNLQAKCDSLSYSFQDSVIRLYTKPVIWSEENQLTADSMAVFTKNRQTDRLELYNNAFITSEIDTIRYNQIKGRTLTGYFKDNELYEIDIKGNGETIYYLLDGEDIAGVNQGTSANIKVYVEKGKVQEIYEYQDPKGFIDPPDPSIPKEIRLPGFIWLDAMRPRDKLDIFRK
jgi:lipopolysaccharide export system protein LptA